MSEIIIGVTGPARSGKNEVAKYLQKYHAFHEDSFAAPIRQACINTLGLKGLEELDVVKQIPQPLFGGKTPREFMQLMGTEFGRNMIYEPIWVDSCLARCGGFERVVISDVRFNNEAEAIIEKNGIIIKVDRPSVRIEQSSHQSESGIRPEYITFEIINDATLDNLYSQIEVTMKKIFKLIYEGIPS